MRWDHGGKGQRLDNDWSRSGGDWNGNPWTEEKQPMYKSVSWYDDPPPPVSGSGSRGWNENPVSCSDWQSSGTRLQTPVSRSNLQSSNTWQHTPASGSDWQSSNRGQRSQPAVAAAVNTNSPDTGDWSNKKSRIQIGVRKEARTRGTHLTVRRSIHGVLSPQM